MKLLFLTNIASYNQMELADQLQARLGNNFRTALISPLTDDRKEMKWQDHYQQAYLIRAYDSPQAKTQMHNWIENADVVIYGRVPIGLVRKRIKNKQLTLAYQERLWKRGKTWRRLLFRLPSLYRQYWSLNKANHHFLAAGSYAASDMRGLAMFENRMWKFGYFVKTKPYCKPEKPASEMIEMLWCGRMIPLKNPDFALHVATRMTQSKLNFRLTMIGAGQLYERIQAQLKTDKLQDRVKLVGWQDGQSVNALMQSADVLLMTSDQQEGWGVVINEALNNGCMVFSNHAAGAARWLINEGKTGLIYDRSSANQKIDQLIKLCRQTTALTEWGRAGHTLHASHWSAEVAAQRLLNLCDALLNNQNADSLYHSGCCSKA